MNIAPLRNNIIFKFVDAVNAKGEFEKETTPSGIILKSSFDDSAKEPRWVNVIEVGPDCTIKPGQQLLLPNLRWTSGFSINSEKFWKTDESQAVAVRDHAQAPLQMLTSYVAFSRNSSTSMSSSSGLLVVGGVTDTPSGLVQFIGPKCPPDLKNATIYYDSLNFTDNFYHGQFPLSFIKDDTILAYAPKDL